MKAERPKPSAASEKGQSRTVFRQPAFLLAIALLLAGVCIAYSKHFNNPFQFDDDHTIVTNQWIRQLDSFPKFFEDARTTSSLPANQAYRPGVTLMHALDYRLALDTTSREAKARLDSAQAAGNRKAVLDSMLTPKPRMFHIHMFIGFILSGFLLFFVLLHIFRQAKPGGPWNEWLALFGMGWFWLHTANAETINYVSARSDSASTFWILLAFVLYFYSKIARKFYLYLLPMIIGFFIKEPALMFAPLLLFCIALFSPEKNALLKGKNLLSLGLAFLFVILLFLLYLRKRPESWDSGGTDWWHYLLTQAFVIVHYCLNFILPVNLSADTDWQPVTRLFDDRVLIGAAFIALLVWIIVRCWKRPEWRPVSFGLIWFFIALAPTSSVFPFAEVLNDHRTYFPYIGLIMAVTWAAGMGLSKLAEKRPAFRTAAVTIAGLVLLLNGAGAYTRSHTWSSGETLWGDCVKKSPANGRAWMHYGMSVFSKGSAAQLRGQKDSANYWYDSADVCYRRSQQLLPYYSYLYINWGVMRQWQERNDEAETFYRNALLYNPGNPEAYFFLGDFLRWRGRTTEAYEVAAKGLQLSPDHERLKGLYSMVAPSNPFRQVAYYEDLVKKQPTPDNYVNLSLAYYNTFSYEKCITAAQKAYELDTTNVAALNNICSACNQLGLYDQAIGAGKKAQRINAAFPQAQGNLNEALRCKMVLDSLVRKMPAKPGADDYINLSLGFYNARMYARTISAAESALKLRPDDAVAWNNICTACNRLSWFDRAVEAGTKAVKLKPGFTLAKNNLEEALRGQQSLQLMQQQL